MTQNIAAAFDGLCGDVIFCAWTGHNPLSPQRADCLLSIYRETCCPVILINPANLPQWIVPEAPLHPAYRYLSETHKADYIRCYLMHHFGGGYTDIKRTALSWKALFAQMRASDAFGLGYTEIGAHGVAPVPGALGVEMRSNFSRIIGNCAYILRRDTAFTRSWIDQTHEVLDAKLEELIRHPAQHPMDRHGVILPDGRPSDYPFRWTELLGEIFQPLVYRSADRFLHGAIAPHFGNYR